MNFENLAGKPTKYATNTVLNEIIRCGIISFNHNYFQDEVLSTYKGIWKNFEFIRAWRYYVVKGFVPINVACKIYQHPIANDIRVAGHCGCENPLSWVKWYTKFHKIVGVLPSSELNNILNVYKTVKSSFVHNACDQLLEENLFSDKPEEDYNSKGYIDLYHIDSELGLYVFMEFIKKYNLTGELVL